MARDMQRMFTAMPHHGSPEYWEARREAAREQAEQVARHTHHAAKLVQSGLALEIERGQDIAKINRVTTIPVEIGARGQARAAIAWTIARYRRTGRGVLFNGVAETSTTRLPRQICASIS